ncbi:MAG: hypothetical protein LT106_15745 [Burkholderiaceae bacterium]|nr:hypothetical protein [Burkholderiaceae bacterium]
MNDSDRRPDGESCTQDTSAQAQSAGRRALLVAMPTIFSLHPGLAAAHARSSSVLVLAKEGTPVDGDGNYLCVEKPWRAESNEKGWLIDRQATLEVTRFPANRQYYSKTTGYKGKTVYTEVNPRQMCRDGGDYYFKEDTKQGSYSSLEENAVELFGKGTDGDKDGNWRRISLGKKGALVSSTALASFGGANCRDVI